MPKPEAAIQIVVEKLLPLEATASTSPLPIGGPGGGSPNGLHRRLHPETGLRSAQGPPTRSARQRLVFSFYVYITRQMQSCLAQSAPFVGKGSLSGTLFTKFAHSLTVVARNGA